MLVGGAIKLQFDVTLGGGGICNWGVEIRMDLGEALAATETVNGDAGEDEEGEVEDSNSKKGAWGQGLMIAKGSIGGVIWSILTAGESKTHSPQFR